MPYPKMGLELYVDIHVGVDASLTVRDGHAIAHAVKDAIKVGTLLWPTCWCISARRQYGLSNRADARAWRIHHGEHEVTEHRRRRHCLE
jgi:hypothetical protein